MALIGHVRQSTFEVLGFFQAKKVPKNLDSGKKSSVGPKFFYLG